jgi:hypothetical protein
MLASAARGDVGGQCWAREYNHNPFACSTLDTPRKAVFERGLVLRLRSALMGLLPA